MASNNMNGEDNTNFREILSQCSNRKKKTCALIFLAKEKQNPCNYSRHMKTNRQLQIYVHVHRTKNHEHYIKSTQSSTTK